MKRNYYSLIKFIFFFIIFYSLSGNIYSNDNLFIQETLLLDIESSNYYDLVIWTNKLGIESTGNVEELRGKLYTYYDISPNIQNKQIENSRSIIIESARELNYIKDVSIDQNYIILHGEVILEMIDPENNTSHKINADKIVFNQSEKTISAFGNIQYEIIREGENEHFYGESLVFEIETWEGIFFEGVSENNKVVEDENVSFFFSGENIYRSSNDRVILTKGSITSSKNEEPYYRIDADKIWVLGPGEWAIKNATLFVGRIPMLYIPFFFLPGDELLFNPAVGYKEVEGYFINTTTYLIGLKEESDADTLSFLKSNDENIIAKEKIRNGLFLTSTERDLDTESWSYSTGSSIKLLADYYSRKGFFFGLDGNLNFDSILKSLNIFTAFSFSKYLFFDNDNDIYTPFRKDVSGNYISDYEESYLFGLRLPFRFAFDINMDISNNWLRINLDLPLYSDTKFRSHFMNREEGVKWTDFLNSDEDTGIQITESEKTSLIWMINGAITPTFESLSPLIENISIDKMDTKLILQSKVLSYPDEIILNANGYTREDTISFYYPSSIILPDLSGRISGTLFQSSNKKSEETDADNLLEMEYEYLIDPWTEESSGIIPEESDLIIKPEFHGYLPMDIVGEKETFSQTLKYSISPSLSNNLIFSSDVPDSEEDVNFTSDYSIRSIQSTSLLDYSFNIYEELLSVSNVSIFSTNYKEHTDRSAGISTPDWNAYRRQDKSATNYKITDSINIVSQPFYRNPIMEKSSVSYNLGTTLYNGYYYYDEASSRSVFVDDVFYDWNISSITSHTASLQLSFLALNDYQLVNLNTVLPSGNANYDAEFYPEVILKTGPVTSSIKTGYKYKTSKQQTEWTFDPYEIFVKYDFFHDNYLKQTVSLDPEGITDNFSRTELFIAAMDSDITLKQNLEMKLNNWQVEESSTDLKLWFMDFNFLAQDALGYHFIHPDDPPVEEGWILDSVRRFQPSKASAGINYSYKPDPFWKNRIRLSADINSSWTMNLLKYTDTALNFSTKFNLYIAEFLELTFESTSVNRAMYKYIPGFANGVGLPTENLIDDLRKSFNFFNREDREISNFNLESLKLTAIHHLSDWDLNFEYTGLKELITNPDNTKNYQWKSEFSIFVIWKPVPEIKQNISYLEDEISF